MTKILTIAKYVTSKRINNKISKPLLYSVLYFIQKEHMIKNESLLFEEEIIKPERDGTKVPMIRAINSYCEGTSFVNTVPTEELEKEIPASSLDIINDIINKTSKMSCSEIAKLLEDEDVWQLTKPGSPVNFVSYSGRKKNYA